MTNDNSVGVGAAEQANDYNAPLEELKKSREAKKGTFMDKLAFWHTSNDAKLSSAKEKYHVGYLTLFFTNKRIQVTIRIEIRSIIYT